MHFRHTGFSATDKIRILVQTGAGVPPRSYLLFRSLPRIDHGFGQRNRMIPIVYLIKQHMKKNPLLVRNRPICSILGDFASVSVVFANEQYKLMQKGLSEEEAYLETVKIIENKHLEIAKQTESVVKKIASIRPISSNIFQSTVGLEYLHWKKRLAFIPYQQWDQHVKLALHSWIARSVLGWNKIESQFLNDNSFSVSIENIRVLLFSNSPMEVEALQKNYSEVENVKVKPFPGENVFNKTMSDERLPLLQFLVSLNCPECEYLDDDKWLFTEEDGAKLEIFNKKVISLLNDNNHYEGDRNSNLETLLENAFLNKEDYLIFQKILLIGDMFLQSNADLTTFQGYLSASEFLKDNQLLATKLFEFYQRHEDILPNLLQFSMLQQNFTHLPSLSSLVEMEDIVHILNKVLFNAKKIKSMKKSSSLLGKALLPEQTEIIGLIHTVAELLSSPHMKEYLKSTRVPYLIRKKISSLKWAEANDFTLNQSDKFFEDCLWLHDVLQEILQQTNAFKMIEAFDPNNYALNFRIARFYRKFMLQILTQSQEVVDAHFQGIKPTVVRRLYETKKLWDETKKIREDLCNHQNELNIMFFGDTQSRAWMTEYASLVEKTLFISDDSDQMMHDEISKWISSTCTFPDEEVQNNSPEQMKNTLEKTKKMLFPHLYVNLTPYQLRTFYHYINISPQIVINLLKTTGCFVPPHRFALWRTFSGAVEGIQKNISKKIPSRFEIMDSIVSNLVSELGKMNVLDIERRKSLSSSYQMIDAWNTSNSPSDDRKVPRRFNQKMSGAITWHQHVREKIDEDLGTDILGIKKPPPSKDLTYKNLNFKEILHINDNDDESSSSKWEKHKSKEPAQIQAHSETDDDISDLPKFKYPIKIPPEVFNFDEKFYENQTSDQYLGLLAKRYNPLYGLTLETVYSNPCLFKRKEFIFRPPPLHK